jgi:hypothetical protein
MLLNALGYVRVLFDDDDVINEIKKKINYYCSIHYVRLVDIYVDIVSDDTLYRKTYFSYIHDLLKYNPMKHLIIMATEREFPDVNTLKEMYSDSIVLLK